MSQQKLQQKAGDNSRSYQAAGDIHVGITVSEARQIALDVFKANALELAGIARDLFEARGRDFIERYLDELQRRKPEGLDSLSDPDMQYALFTAQREYARTGDKDLSDLLVDILVERSAQKDRNLQQIVLSEALAVAPKLTPEQFNALSVVMILRYTRCIGVRSLNELDGYMRLLLPPFCSGLPTHLSTYQHLEFVGCASRGWNKATVGDLVLGNYQDLFCSGFNVDEAANLADVKKLLGTFLIPCLHDPTRLQVKDSDLAMPQEMATQLSVSVDEIVKLQQLHKSRLMSPNEVTAYLYEHVLGTAELVRCWETSELCRLSLTSVGTAIAIANIRRRTGQEFDLGIWIK
jgi:hypothetical protein